MVNSLLFRWEDSSALKHHCGFCERPLSHPGARASCFGTHAEPCHRFHQAMFMRLRAHTCAYCLTIDEAHWKRHKEIAETLYSIYESCNEVDWSIVPSEPDERGRLRALHTPAGEREHPAHIITLEDTSSSKREKKDAKRLARAASRARVITQEEIQHVDSVIHLVEGASGNDDDGPRNQEEIDEIEQHLRYNAHVYNSKPNTRELKKLAKLVDFAVEVDFDAEMDRMFDTFRITELMKRNTKNRGLQGKELKGFQSLVDDIKKAIAEDLVLVKKDMLEIRMRRAGYLRYTNKTAYGIVEDRYTDKDWKTGEKLASGTSNSSSAMSLAEGSSSSASDQKENLAPQPRASMHASDHRHLESVHTRVNRKDGLYDQVLEPYHTPLLPLLPDLAPRNKVTSLKVVASNFPETLSSRKNAWGKKTQHNQHLDGWETIAEGKKPRVVIVKSDRESKTDVHLSKPDLLGTDYSSSETADVSRSSPSIETKKMTLKFTAPAVQAPAATAVYSLTAPERLWDPLLAAATESTQAHPVISQKKVKKSVREAKRKAKKVAVEEPIAKILRAHDIDTLSTPNLLGEAIQHKEVVLMSDSEDVAFTEKVGPSETLELSSDESYELKTNVAFTGPSTDQVPQESTAVPELPLHALTNHGKHSHWMRFTRRFIVDQLTDPFLEPFTSCAHGTSCAFEKIGTADCPFHEPHCPCVDPLNDLCYLVYPTDEPFSFGPCNRVQGEMALAIYEGDDRTKNRLMLVDSDLINYFMGETPNASRDSDNLSIPARLRAEYDEFDAGYYPGKLMEQERQYDRLLRKNNLTQHLFSRKLLQEIMRRKVPPAGGATMCYCHSAIPREGVDLKLVVECSHRDCTRVYFHKTCIKKLGVEKVSRWYCTACEKKMKLLARQTLRDMGFTNVPVEHGDDEFDEQTFEDVLQMPNAVYNQMKESIQGTAGHVKSVGVMAFDIDHGKVTFNGTHNF